MRGSVAFVVQFQELVVFVERDGPFILVIIPFGDLHLVAFGLAQQLPCLQRHFVQLLRASDTLKNKRKNE